MLLPPHCATLCCISGGPGPPWSMPLGALRSPQAALPAVTSLSAFAITYFSAVISRPPSAGGLVPSSVVNATRCCTNERFLYSGTTATAAASSAR